MKLRRKRMVLRREENKPWGNGVSRTGPLREEAQDLLPRECVKPLLLWECVKHLLLRVSRICS